jgi:hypothetical protein
MILAAITKILVVISFFFTMEYIFEMKEYFFLPHSNKNFTEEIRPLINDYNDSIIFNNHTHIHIPYKPLPVCFRNYFTEIFSTRKCRPKTEKRIFLENFILSTMSKLKTLYIQNFFRIFTENNFTRNLKNLTRRQIKENMGMSLIISVLFVILGLYILIYFIIGCKTNQTKTYLIINIPNENVLPILGNNIIKNDIWDNFQGVKNYNLKSNKALEKLITNENLSKKLQILGENIIKIRSYMDSLKEDIIQNIIRHLINMETYASKSNFEEFNRNLDIINKISTFEVVPIFYINTTLLNEEKEKINSIIKIYDDNNVTFIMSEKALSDKYITSSDEIKIAIEDLFRISDLDKFILFCHLFSNAILFLKSKDEFLATVSRSYQEIYNNYLTPINREVANSNFNENTKNEILVNLIKNCRNKLKEFLSNINKFFP